MKIKDEETMSMGISPICLQYFKALRFSID